MVNRSFLTVKKNLFITLLFVVSFITITWLWLSPSGLEKAPDVTLQITDGSSVSLEKLQHRPVLVTFWATSCVSCVREIPHLISLYNDFSDQGLEIIGVAMPYDRPDRVLAMIAKKKINYPIALDIEGKAIAAFGFGNTLVTPTSFLIAPGGKIVKHAIGEMNMKKLRQTILDMLLTAR